jgi:hypothetical protein
MLSNQIDEFRTFQIPDEADNIEISRASIVNHDRAIYGVRVRQRSRVY